MQKKLGYQFSGLHVPESEVGNYGLAYRSFVPLLVKALQEQQVEIENGNLRMVYLKAQNAAEDAEIKTLKA